MIQEDFEFRSFIKCTLKIWQSKTWRNKFFDTVNSKIIFIQKKLKKSNQSNDIL